jgi:hypothetical protein
MTQHWSPQELEAARRRLKKLRGDVVQSAREERRGAPQADGMRDHLAAVEGSAREASETAEQRSIGELERLMSAAESAPRSDLGRVLRRLGGLAQRAASPRVRQAIQARLQGLVARLVRGLASGNVDRKRDGALIEALAALAGTGVLASGPLAGLLASLDRDAAAARGAGAASQDSQEAAPELADPRAAFADRLLSRMDSNIQCARLAERAETFGGQQVNLGVAFADAIERRMTRSNLGVLKRVGHTMGIAESFSRFDRRFGMLQAILGGALEGADAGSTSSMLAAALSIDVAGRMEGAGYGSLLSQLPELVVAVRMARMDAADAEVSEVTGGGGYAAPRVVDYSISRPGRTMGFAEITDYSSHRDKTWHGFDDHSAWRAGASGRGWVQPVQRGGVQAGAASFSGVGFGGFEAAGWSQRTGLGMASLAPVVQHGSYRSPAVEPAHAKAVRAAGGLSHLALGFGGLGGARLQSRAAAALGEALPALPGRRADLLMASSPITASGHGVRGLGLTSSPRSTGGAVRMTGLSFDSFGVPRLRGGVRVPDAALQAISSFDPMGSLVMHETSRSRRSGSQVRPDLVARPRPRVRPSAPSPRGFTVDDFGISRLESLQLGAPTSQGLVPGFTLGFDGGQQVPSLRLTPLGRSVSPIASSATRLGRFAAPQVSSGAVALGSDHGWLTPAMPLLRRAGAVSTPPAYTAQRSARTAPPVAASPSRVRLPAMAGGLMPQIRSGGRQVAGFGPQALVTSSAHGSQVFRPQMLDKYYMPAEHGGLALGAVGQFQLPAFSRRSPSAHVSAPVVSAPSSLGGDFAPPELMRLGGSRGVGFRQLSPVLGSGGLRGIAAMPFDDAGFAPSRRIGRVADIDVRSGSLAAPRWFRLGRDLESTRGRYSGERLHQGLGLDGLSQSLSLRLGGLRRQRRSSSPRLTGVYGARPEVFSAEAPGDVLGLRSHGGLEALYAPSRSVPRFAGLGYDADIASGAHRMAASGPSMDVPFVASAAQGGSWRSVSRPAPAPAPASASASAPAAAARGGGGGAWHTPYASVSGGSSGVLYRYMDALGVSSQRVNVLHAGAPSRGSGGAGGVGLSDRFRLDGWVGAEQAAGGQGPIGRGFEPESASVRRWSGLIRRQRTSAASVPLDLVSQLSGATPAAAEAYERRLVRSSQMSTSRRGAHRGRVHMAAPDVAPAARLRGTAPAGRTQRSRLARYGFGPASTAAQSGGWAPRITLAFTEESGAGAPGGLRLIGHRRRHEQLPMLPGIELGGAVIQRRARAGVDNRNARRVGMDVPIGAEWLQAAESGAYAGAGVPAALLPITTRARRSRTVGRSRGAGFAVPTSKTRHAGASFADLVQQMLGRGGSRPQRPVVETQDLEPVRRSGLESFELVSGEPSAPAQRPTRVRPNRGLSDAFRLRGRSTAGSSGPVFRPSAPRSSGMARYREPMDTTPPRLKMVNTGTGAPRQQYDLAEVLQQAFDLPEEALPVMRKGLFSGLASNIKKSLGEVKQWIAQLEDLGKARKKAPALDKLVVQVYERIIEEMRWESARRGCSF